MREREGVREAPRRARRACPRPRPASPPPAGVECIKLFSIHISDFSYQIFHIRFFISDFASYFFSSLYSIVCDDPTFSQTCVSRISKLRLVSSCTSILVYLVIYDSGEVSLEHLLLEWYPSQKIQKITSRMSTFCSSGERGRIGWGDSDSGFRIQDSGLRVEGVERRPDDTP